MSPFWRKQSQEGNHRSPTPRQHSQAPGRPAGRRSSDSSRRSPGRRKGRAVAAGSADSDPGSAMRRRAAPGQGLCSRLLTSPSLGGYSGRAQREAPPGPYGPRSPAPSPSPVPPPQRSAPPRTPGRAGAAVLTARAAARRSPGSASPGPRKCFSGNPPRVPEVTRPSNPQTQPRPRC